ncbi:MAG: CatB-related O-acetyltransferase [Candidatus Ancillula sp.]|jgi:virginiamycin A acetyltransferase|nr:CatB-related O-acetyltransferase [Candidatus Ancillula sp.]
MSMVENLVIPDPEEKYPVETAWQMTYIRPTLTRSNIIVGDYSYFADADFDSHVTHHYDFLGDKLVIGKFCQIAKGVEFIMNGANHQMNCVSTYPFYIFGWNTNPPELSDLPIKGDTVVQNDVWIGQNSTILPGCNIADGAIVGANSTVASDVEPYTIVAGNPAKFVRRRFDNELTALLLELKWWDLPYKKVAEILPLLNNSKYSDLEYEKQEIQKLVEQLRNT